MPLSDLPSARQWPYLTLAPGKRAAFSTDLYFREGWADLSELGQDRAASLFTDIALLSFKPDATIGRRMTRTVTYLTEHGFVPVAITRVRHTRHSVRELYRFTWDIYTMDRLALATTMHTSRETLLLMLKDIHYGGTVPASVRLSELKGSSNPQKRSRTQLRAVLKPPHEIINFVHVADEPADIVRELAIYMEPAARRRLMTQTLAADEATNVSGELTNEIACLEHDAPQHDFDPDTALTRLAAAGGTLDDARCLLSLSHKITWQELCRLVTPTSKNLWDFASVAAAVLELNRDGTIDLLPRAGAAQWRANTAPDPLETP